MRLDTIDGIRGHLLLGMMIAHLAFSSGTAETANFLLDFHHWRLIGMYDAEFFVPISGFLMGYLFRNKWQSRATKLQDFLWERSLKVYRYQLICALPILLFLGFDHGLWGWITEFFATLAGVFFLQAGFSYSDILPIYLACFVILMLACWFRIVGNPLLLLGYCLGIYALGQRLWFDNLNFIAFDVLSWSLLFNLFFMAGMYRNEITGFSERLALPVRLALIAVFAVTWLSIWQFELYPEMLTHLSEKPNSNWYRTQLNPAYLLMIGAFVGIFVLIMTYRQRLALIRWPQSALTFYFNLPFLRHIGRQSLQMFVAHVFIVNGYILLLRATDAPVQIPAAGVCMVLFLLYAYRDWISGWWQPKRTLTGATIKREA